MGWILGPGVEPGSVACEATVLTAIRSKQLCVGAQNFNTYKDDFPATVAHCFWWSMDSLYLQVTSLVILLIILPKLYPLFVPRPIDRWTGQPMSWFHTLLSSNFLAFASYWNNYEIHGDEHLTGGNCLVIGFHTRSTFDNFYVLTSLRPRFVASFFLFHLPFTSTLFHWWGAFPSKGLNSKTTDSDFLNILLYGTAPVLVLPGGSYEAYKPYEERYKVDWKINPGFARLLVNHAEENPLVYQTRIIPFYTKNGDEILYNHPWWYTLSSQYSRKALLEIRNGNYLYIFSLMFFGGLGLGFLPFPRPIKLDTFYGSPLKLKKGETSIAFGKRVQQALQDLIDKVNTSTPLASPNAITSVVNERFQKKRSRGRRGRGGGSNGHDYVMSCLRKVYGVLFGIYLLGQNFCLALFGMFSTFLAVPFFLLTGLLQTLGGGGGGGGRKNGEKSD
jgi:1-acyl-sn-glycerol-3-phosphate acyltransferase